YLALPYTLQLRRDQEGDFVAKVVELDGCVAHGATEAEALERLREMQSLWLQDALEAGSSIPVPQQADEELPSGKWLQRVPRSLHAQLAKLAVREGVSLNQLVTSLLSEAVGRSAPKPSATAHIGAEAALFAGTTVSVGLGAFGEGVTNIGHAAATAMCFIGAGRGKYELIPAWDIASGVVPADPATLNLEPFLAHHPDQVLIAQDLFENVYERQLSTVSRERSATSGRTRLLQRER